MCGNTGFGGNVEGVFTGIKLESRLARIARENMPTYHRASELGTEHQNGHNVQTRSQ
jgi:hypothetical protein